MNGHSAESDAPGPLFDWAESYAHLSGCEQYRYTLGRRWGSGAVVTFVMLNPSTADASADDPTIRKCKGFAERYWEAGGIHVVNLYAYRATKPPEMWAASKRGIDIIGPENDEVLRSTFSTAYGEGSPVVAAWGANTKGLRPDFVHILAKSAGVQLLALATTKDGIPGHPLMLAYANQPKPWPTRPTAPAKPEPWCCEKCRAEGWECPASCGRPCCVTPPGSSAP